MKSSFSIKLCLILVLAFLLGCGSGNTNSVSRAGSVTAQLKWIEKTGPSAKSSGSHLFKAPQGVITVRIVVSGSDMSNVQQDFSSSDGTAVIDGVPVGSNRIVTAQGLDETGVVTHQGVISNITVQTGQITDAGTVVMNPAGQTFSVSGRIALNNSGLPGVTVSLQGTSFSTVTGSDGTYTLTGVPNASYTIVPSIAGYTFATATRSVPDSNGDVTGQDFIAAPIPAQTFTVSGMVTVNGNGLPGVTVSLQGTSFSAVTGSNGIYALTGVPNGTYTVIPSMTGYAFTPSSLTVSVNNGDMTGQDFIATVLTYSISGTVTLNGSGLPGVTVSLQGTSSNSVTTGPDGAYSFTGAQNGLYTVTPSLAGYVFSPANLSVSVNNGNMTGQDFIASIPTYTISGSVTLNGSGLSGVTVSLQGAASSSLTTGSDGAYLFTGAQNGSYTVTASLAGYTFAPSNISVSVNNGNVTGQNFAATLPGIFSQADLIGNWDSITFSPGTNSSNSSNWTSESSAIDGQGNYTCIAHQTSKGDTTCSGGSVVLAIDSSGTVTAPGSNFNGNMSLDKNLIVATLTENSDTFRLVVLRKRAPGVTYSSADVANLQFAFHTLNGGSSSDWNYGTGSTNASGQATITSFNTPSGPVNPPNPVTLQIDSNGNVTVAENSTFHGIITPDKKVIFAVDTDTAPGVSPARYQFFAILVTGQTFATADLAGAGDFHNIWNTGWNRGTFVIDTAGNQTYLSSSESSGNSVLPANDVVSITASGVLTKSSNASYHGQLSFNKNLNVHTNTDGNGHNRIGISMNLPTGGITVEWKRKGQR